MSENHGIQTTQNNQPTLAEKVQVLNGDQKRLIKKQFGSVDLTDDEMQLFLEVCKRYKFDPFHKKLFAVRRKNKKTGRYEVSFNTTIDGLRTIAERTRSYAGNDDPVFDQEEVPRKATVTVWRLLEGQRCPFTASARWDQYCPLPPADHMWNRMPHIMLGKCAEALALRKAFPSDMGGLYTNDEMAQADGGVVSTTAKPVNAPESRGNGGQAGTGAHGEAPQLPYVWKASEAQLKRLYTIAWHNKWPDDEVKAAINIRFGVDSSTELNREQYDELCDKILPRGPNGGGPPAMEEPPIPDDVDIPGDQPRGF